jgi:diguanylate cyclase (GGDEF)-like protein
MAYHDKLTGLPNLRFFKEKIDDYLAVGTQNQENDLFAVMFIDLDGFKNVNDHFGHDIGDLLLIDVSKRITSCLGEGDIASRIGGDEFTILLPKIKSEEDAIAIANSIIDVVGSPYELQGNQIHVITSIGISYSTYNRIDRRAIIKNADSHMHSVL